jgi:hypothetical protein
MTAQDLAQIPATVPAVTSVPGELVDIRTGELVPATPEKAVELLGVAREMRGRLLDLVKDCEAVILEASRRQGTKTLHFEDATATVTGGSDLDWDLDVLRELLAKGLPDARFNELVVATVTYKVDARVAKQLEAANPAYAAVIARARSRVEKPWRVSIR